MDKTIGIILMIFSTLCYGTLGTLMKKVNNNFSPFWIITISMLILLLISFTFAMIFNRSELVKVVENKQDIAILIGVGIINFIGFYLLVRSYEYLKIWEIAMFSIFGPVIGGIFAYFILGEELSMKLFLGLIIMAIGLYISIK